MFILDKHLRDPLLDIRKLCLQAARWECVEVYFNEPKKNEIEFNKS